jgi:hypothetical protein
VNRIVDEAEVKAIANLLNDVYEGLCDGDPLFDSRNADFGEIAAPTAF